VAAELLAYLLAGELPTFDLGRQRNSSSLLWSDLERQGYTGVKFYKYGRVSISGAIDVEVPILAVRRDGKRFVISLSGPLAVDYSADKQVRELQEREGDIEFIIINELLVRGNLPAATREVQQRLRL
jgi:hypothetical protein